MKLTNEYIRKIQKNEDFTPLFEYFLEIYDDLGDNSDLDLRRKDKALGEKLRARLVARKAIYKILQPFLDFKEKSEPTEEQRESARKRYGL